MNGCRVHRETMSALLDGAATPDEQRALDLHLEGCAECRKALEELRWTTGQLRRLEPVEPPPWMTARIMARVRADDAPAPSIWRRFFFPVLASAQFRVATLVLVGAVGYYVVSRSPGMLREAAEGPRRQESPSTQPAPAPPPAPASPEAKRDFAPPPAGPAALQDKARTDVSSRPAAEALPLDRRGAAEAPLAAKRKGAESPYSTESKGTRASGAADSAAEPPPPMAAAPAEKASATDLGFSEHGQEALGGTAGGVLGAVSASKPGAAAPAPPVVRQAPAPSAATELRSRDQVKEERAAPARTDLLVVTIEPFDPSGFRALAERELARLGAEGVTPAGEAPARSVSARIDSKRLPELLERLARAGTIREKRDGTEPLPPVISVTIRW